jgi:hypothetical protein
MFLQEEHGLLPKLLVLEHNACDGVVEAIADALGPLSEEKYQLLNEKKKKKKKNEFSGRYCKFTNKQTDTDKQKRKKNTNTNNPSTQKLHRA